jgi:hypothetical protein
MGVQDNAKLFDGLLHVLSSLYAIEKAALTYHTQDKYSNRAGDPAADGFSSLFLFHIVQDR